MNIYLISQSTNDDYETYDSAVVIAENEEQAQKTHPEGQYTNLKTGESIQRKEWSLHNWTEPKYVDVVLIGKALDTEFKPRVVCASFNAG